MFCGQVYLGQLGKFQYKAERPPFSTKFKSFKEVPLGCFSPCSHCLTVERLVFKCFANTAWLTFSRSLIFLISCGFNSCTGGIHKASNSLMVTESITPAL